MSRAFLRITWLRSASQLANNAGGQSNFRVLATSATALQQVQQLVEYLAVGADAVA